MTEWWAKLQGDKRELEILKEHLAGSNHRIIQDGSFYYLKLGDLPEDIDPSILQDRLGRLIALLNGAAKLRFSKFAGVSSHAAIRFNKDGTKTGFGFLTLAERSFTLTLLPDPDETLSSWILAGSKDNLVERALVLYGTQDHNWRSLYMVLEVVEDDLGGEAAIVQTKWVSSTRLKNFKRTANSFGALGQEARHAKINIKPPSSPMSLTDAKELVDEILQKWLERKRITLSIG